MNEPLKRKEPMPNVLSSFHLAHIKRHAFDSGLLVETLMALPMVAHYVYASDTDRDSSKGLTKPSSPTIPLV
jgi:hypothetical protein